MDRPEDWLACATELLDRGYLAEADALARDGLDRFPDAGRLWRLRGLLRIRLGDIAGACSALETASLLVPLDPAACCALAECHAREGRHTLARDLFRSLASEYDCPTELLPAVASGLGSLGDDWMALKVCRELSSREPDRHEALFGQAFYLRRLGHSVEQVLTLVSRAHELAPTSTLYRVTLASLLDHVGRGEDARDILRAVDPNAVHCLCCLRRMMAILGVNRPDASEADPTTPNLPLTHRSSEPSLG